MNTDLLGSLHVHMQSKWGKEEIITKLFGMIGTCNLTNTIFLTDSCERQLFNKHTNRNNYSCSVLNLSYHYHLVILDIEQYHQILWYQLCIFVLYQCLPYYFLHLHFLLFKNQSFFINHWTIKAEWESFMIENC